MKIISVDPGKTTGVAMYQVENFESRFAVYQFTNIPDVIELLKKELPDVVLVESFKLHKNKATQLSGQENYSAEVIGAIKVFCAGELIPIRQQAPAVKDTVMQSLLERIGFWLPTKGMPHARDAARHLAAYLFKSSGVANVEI